jgi:hypothetical protein
MDSIDHFHIPNLIEKILYMSYFPYRWRYGFLAERLKNVLTKLIHPDQKGFVKGEANRMIQDIIQYADEENEEGIIVFLDQQKAFDRVYNWFNYELFPLQMKIWFPSHARKADRTTNF